MSTQQSTLPRLFNGTALTALVLLWLIPTLGLFVSSIRDKDALAASGWWTAFSESTQTTFARTQLPSEQIKEGNSFVLAGQLTAEDGSKYENILAFGSSARDPQEAPAGETLVLKTEINSLFTAMVLTNTAHQRRSLAVVANVYSSLTANHLDSPLKTMLTY